MFRQAQHDVVPFKAPLWVWGPANSSYIYTLYIYAMKYKNIFIGLLVCATAYLHAQVKVLDPDNMQPVQASESHSQTIQDILPMGNWLANKKLDSLKTGDTLTLTNDNTIRESDLNFSKTGNVTRYTQHMENSRAKDGSTTLGFSNTWDEIGKWSIDNDKNVFVMIFGNPNVKNDQGKGIIFKEVSKSYQVIKLITGEVRIYDKATK
jgi:hypothetical protein